MKREPITIAKVQELSEMKLPSEEWECVRAEIKFERKGMLGEWAMVVYDGHNQTFYVQTNKAIVYQDDTKALEEAISLMRKANRIINSPRTEDAPQ